MDQCAGPGAREGRAAVRSASNALVVIHCRRRREMPAALARSRAAWLCAHRHRSAGPAPVGLIPGRCSAGQALGTIRPKMISASSVRQALDYVARAEVDAGFVRSFPSCPAFSFFHGFFYLPIFTRDAALFRFFWPRPCWFIRLFSESAGERHGRRLIAPASPSWRAGRASSTRSWAWRSLLRDGALALSGATSSTPR